MANNYFKFKQFIAYHDKCSMKVCTDSCILGAWAAEKIKDQQPAVHAVLDIGTGSGLLSLMIAQKSPSEIEAIEIDENAFQQAGDNFKRSLWNARLQAFHTDAKCYYPKKKYDFIISNPPFYEDHLLSPEKITNVAMHDEGLKLHELITVIKTNLHSHGSFALLLPYNRLNYFENIAAENLFFLKEKLLIKQTSKHDFFRGILLFTQTKNFPVINELIIKDNGNYSGDFIALMKDYYLNL